jgi:hypothetical protein
MSLVIELMAKGFHFITIPQSVVIALYMAPRGSKKQRVESILDIEKLSAALRIIMALWCKVHS